jgi:methionine biosynthesis protein MetW
MGSWPMRSESLALEYGVILEWIEAESSVLDLGCGDGELLSLLVREKKIKAQGIEIDEQAIYRCVARGLSVFHQDIDNGLSEYADKSFNYVILNQSFQQVKKPDIVLTEALRVSEKVIISFPNFAHYRARVQLCFNGRTPITSSLPYEWHDTPNLHFLSILDFIDYCRDRKIRLEKTHFLANNRSVRILPNLFALTGIFMISTN